jgi:D-xylose transport system substrate-binding protein
LFVFCGWQAQPPKGFLREEHMSQSKRVIGILATLLALASLVVACAAPVAAPAAAPAGDAAATGDKIKVGLSFSDFATERWKNEEVLIRGLLEE